nr:probable Rho GTPase-activating protein CG5521 [Halyomorpha halys]
MSNYFILSFPESISEHPGSDLLLENSILNPLSVNNLPQDTLRHRPPYILPTFGNSAQDMDNLDDLLQYIGYTSPEILESLDLARNVPPASINLELEEEAMGAILGMRIMHHANISQSSTCYVEGVKKTYVDSHEDIAPFQYCRLLFSQFGMHGWDLRSQLYLVDKNEKLLREMRNLDSQRCRQTHKVAVIYVAQGQEDKNSILSNSGGSQAYEDFIAGLAWETRHLGNDEVHIVWSEHTREYRRGIIPTEFCDVLIVIYPLPHNLYRIQVSRKPDVPYFGPLYNEALVGHMELPGLVRATALSASRAKRSMLPFYQQYYEERGRSLEAVIKSYRKHTTFEEFAANIYSPQEYNSLNICQGSTGSEYGGSLQNAEECSSSLGSNSSTTLAALLDTTTFRINQHSHMTDDSGTSYTGVESEISSCSGVSPRSLKKMGMKSGYKKPQPLLTPPDSPTSRRSK